MKQCIRYGDGDKSLLYNKRLTLDVRRWERSHRAAATAASPSRDCLQKHLLGADGVGVGVAVAGEVRGRGLFLADLLFLHVVT